MERGVWEGSSGPEPDFRKHSIRVGALALAIILVPCRMSLTWTFIRFSRRGCWDLGFARMQRRSWPPWPLQRGCAGVVGISASL
eukprot:12374508-Alexandrium_andersonii.AAC.2